VAQWQLQLGLRDRGRGAVHSGNVPGSLEDVAGRCLDRCVDFAPFTSFRIHGASACHVYTPRDKGFAEEEEKLVLISEGEVAEGVHKDAHLGGMAVTRTRHKRRGADWAASDLHALLSVGHPKEQGSLMRRGGGVPKHAAFVWGFGESNGGGCEWSARCLPAVRGRCQRGKRRREVLACVSPHAQRWCAQVRSAEKCQRGGALVSPPGGRPSGKGSGGCQGGRPPPSG
jgi:hypothetical protein